MIRTLALIAALALAAACEPPPVETSREKTQSSRIEGSIVATGRMRGNAILFLFDAAHPPPPDGTGRPVSFAVVSGETLFGAALSQPANLGPFTAPFTFSQVLPGSYVIKGFIDNRDGTAVAGGISGRVPDFNPWYGVTSEVNRGDVGGAAVDLATYLPKVLTIPPAADGGTLAPLSDVTVVLQESATTTVPFDRPAFQVTGDPENGVFHPQMGVLSTNKPLTLQISTLQQGVVDERGPAFFLLHYVDANGDRIPDRDAANNPMVWPKVFVRKLADTPTMLLDENDLNHDGLLDQTGLDYARMPTGALDGKPDAVVLGAFWDPADLTALGSPSSPNTNGDGSLVTVPVTTLHLVLGTPSGPLALDASNPASPVPLATIPKGKYAIVVMNLSGQTWRVPNELNPAVAPLVGLPSVDTQRYVVDVQ